MRLLGRKPPVQAPPTTIDYVALLADGTVALLLAHDSSQPIEQLQQRVHGYVGFAVDGQMTRDYPQTEGRPVSIMLIVPEQPTGNLAAYIDLIRPSMAQEGIGLTVEVEPV